MGLGSLVGYDDKGQSSFFAARPIEKSLNGFKDIASFLKRYQNLTEDQIVVTTRNGKEYLVCNGDTRYAHRVKFHKGRYEITIPKDYNQKVHNNPQNLTKLVIEAKSPAHLKEKIVWILNHPVARAKLDFKDPKFIGKKHIKFNENRVVGNFDMQQFKNIGNPGLAEGFDSEIGSVDMHQINYHGPIISYQGYSSLKDPNKHIEKVKDFFWSRVHNMSSHVLSSTVIDELLGNVVNIFYAKTGVSPEGRAEMVQNMREDYLFNLSGPGSRNGRMYQDASDIFDSPTKFQSFISQLHLTADPYRGGRVWRRDLPPSLAQTLALMYRPTGDGRIEHLYDTDPKKFMKNMDKLKISIEDRQFMAAYGRKILGIYIALKFIRHDISMINLNKDTPPKERQKWRDLTKLHDALFASAGDLKDFLRHNASGFAQVSHSVKAKELPKIIKTPGINTNKAATRKHYHEMAKKTLYPIILNYTQFQSYLSLNSRERGSTILFNTLKTQVFKRDVPDMVASAATVMLLEGADLISRRLKFINEVIGQDTDLKGAVTMVGNKLKQGDIDGATSLVAHHSKRMMDMLSPDLLFPHKKFQALHTEGFMWDKEIVKPIVPNYQTTNKDLFMGSVAPVYMIERNGQVLTAKLVEALKVHARLIEDIHTEMRTSGIESPYDTKAIETMGSYMQSAAMEITKQFVKDHQAYFADIPDDKRNKILNDLYKECYAFEELIANVACVLATEKQVTYGPQAALDRRQGKRNETLAKESIIPERA